MATAGCGSLTVVQQAQPNPFAGRNHFWVAPLDVSRVEVVETAAARALSDGLAGEERRRVHDGRVLTQVLRNVLRGSGLNCNVTDETTAPPAPFHVIAQLERVDVSMTVVPDQLLIVVPAQKVEVRMRVWLEDVSGHTLDELEMKASCGPTNCMVDFAQWLARYLRRRVGG